jgi:uncharacterized protein YlxW (UPF0749 family)
VLATVGFGVGLVFAAAAVTADRAGPSGGGTTLQDLVTADRAAVGSAHDQAAALRQAIATETASPGAADLARARADLDALRGPAGLTAVHGPAVTVTLDDTPRERRSGPWPRGVRTPGPDDLVVHQQDVQAVVNALWSGGAEAVTIMNQRVTALTAVQCVGNTLRLHGDVYSPPFTISAIGDVTRMRRALDGDPGVDLYRQYVAAYQLGYRVDAVADAVFPAYAQEPGPGRATPLSPLPSPSATPAVSAG